MNSSRSIRTAFASLFTLALANVVHAERLDMLGMGMLAGDRGSAAADINDLGAMAGYSSAFEFGNSHAVVWKRGAGLKSIGHLPGDKNSEGLGINNIGTVVGNSDLRPFIWTAAGGIKALPMMIGRIGGNAKDVNNAGMTVGYLTKSLSVEPIPVSWNDNLNLRVLELLPGGSQGEARRANDENMIVGWTDSLTGRRATLWGGKGVTNLGILAGCTSSEANGINLQGTVVGSCMGNTGRIPFVWTPQAGMKALSVPAWATEGSANAVSKAGTIVGVVRAKWGTEYAVCWKGNVVTSLSDIAPKISATFRIYDASSINDVEQVSGSWVRSGIRNRGFLGKVIR